MKTLAERLTWARNEAGLTQQELAKKTGVAQSTIASWESGARETGRKISVVADFLGVNSLWLSEGKGSARTSTTNESASSRVAEVSNVIDAPLGTHRIPLLNYVQAGAMREVLDQPWAGEFLIAESRISSSSFALEIRGESMLPQFREGDRVIIDPDVVPQPGDMVVAKNGGEEATFKKYRPRGVGEDGKEIFELVPLNEDYPSMRSDVTPLVIIGTMVEHRQYRRR